MQPAEHVLQFTGERGWRRAAARRAVTLLALASLTITVPACREDEQDRPLAYDKGTYQGQADQKLDQAQVEVLRQRAAEQQI
jgi:hypothetical protein